MIKINKIYDKLFGSDIVSYILSARYCDKHIKNIGSNTVMTLGICSRCHKSGIVYYKK